MNTTRYKMLRQDRTPQEKERRSIHGDVGAQFSHGKCLVPRNDDCSNTITTVEKDNLLMSY